MCVLDLGVLEVRTEGIVAYLSCIEYSMSSKRTLSPRFPTGFFT